jgi:hypothetical protein
MTAVAVKTLTRRTLMIVTYLLNSEANSLKPREEEDLRRLVEEVCQGLRTRHPELGTDPHLLLCVTDGLLNGLADGSTEIDLGELCSPASTLIPAGLDIAPQPPPTVTVLNRQSAD